MALTLKDGLSMPIEVTVSPQASNLEGEPSPNENRKRAEIERDGEKREERERARQQKDCQTGPKKYLTKTLLRPQIRSKWKKVVPWGMV